MGTEETKFQIEKCDPSELTPKNDITRTHIVTYLSNFLAGQRGFSTPVSDFDKERAGEMADDILGWIRKNNLLR
jgi:hypothetical protein